MIGRRLVLLSPGHLGNRSVYGFWRMKFNGQSARTSSSTCLIYICTQKLSAYLVCYCDFRYEQKPKNGGGLSNLLHGCRHFGGLYGGSPLAQGTKSIKTERNKREKQFCRISAPSDRNPFQQCCGENQNEQSVRQSQWWRYNL